MNNRIYLAAVVTVLFGLALVLSASPGPPHATAATGQSHADHDHGQEKKAAPHPEEELDALFEEDGHEEDGHAKSGVHGSHSDHEEHGQEKDASSHAGHEHGGHAHTEDAEPGICPEHGVPEEEDALCHGDHIGELQPGEGMKVRLASAEAAEKAGVRLTSPRAVSLAGGVALPGRAEFNRNRLAHITPLAGGVIRKVMVRPGAQVKKGEVLAEIDMPEMASLKAQLLSAAAREKQTEAVYLREKDLLERGITSRQEFQQAESEYRSARSASAQYRQQLSNFGLSPADIGRLLRTGDGSAATPLRAPFEGTVADVKTAMGEAVAPGTALFTVADLDLLWIELSLPESRIYQARVEAPIQARFDGLPGMTFTGQIFQVGAALDERSRTLKAFAEVKNPGHRLKAGMFGKVHLLEGTETQALSVPADALQSIDGLSFVFVQQDPDLFELRRVQAGAPAEGTVPILAGLSPGEQVVSSQGFALKSEVLKARLGASCADH